MKRSDILFHMPTQREENNLGYDAMVVGVWAALQFKRAAYVRRDGAAWFSIDLEQAKTLQDLLPQGGAFYALAPIAELDPFIKSPPKILEQSYLVDVDRLAALSQGKGTASLWMTKDGSASAQVRGSGGTSSLGASLKISALCCPREKAKRHIGFGVGKGGQIFYGADPRHGGKAAPEPWHRRVVDVARHLRDVPVLRLSAALPWDRR